VCQSWPLRASSPAKTPESTASANPWYTPAFDGQWHVHIARLGNIEQPTGPVAVGIDSLRPEAEIEPDSIAFSSVRPRVALEEAFAYQG
jgi:hypothetical protein